MQHLGFPALRHEFPQLHRQHVVQLVAQLIQSRLVDVDESAGSIHLIDHLRAMLDQVAVLFFKATDFDHPLFDLPERALEIGRHLVEGLGQTLDFIAGLELQALIQAPAADLLDAVVQQLDGSCDPPGHKNAGAP